MELKNLDNKIRYYNLITNQLANYVYSGEKEDGIKSLRVAYLILGQLLETEHIPLTVKLADEYEVV